MKLKIAEISAVVVAVMLTGCGSTPGGSMGGGLGGSPPAPGSKPYQAAYEVPSGTTIMHQKHLSDGHGVLRFEMGGENGMPVNVSIYDTNKKEILGWQEGTGQYIRRQIKPTENAMFDPAAMKQAQGESLGAKNIDGHNCHGWKSQGPGAINSEAWIDDDYGIVVTSTSGGPGGAATMKLVSFSKDTPSAALFQPPAGYTEMQIPAGAQ